MRGLGVLAATMAFSPAAAQTPVEHVAGSVFTLDARSAPDLGDVRLRALVPLAAA